MVVGDFTVDTGTLYCRYSAAVQYSINAVQYCTTVLYCGLTALWHYSITALRHYCINDVMP